MKEVLEQSNELTGRNRTEKHKLNEGKRKEQLTTHLVRVMCTVWERDIHLFDDTFNLVPARPLRIAGVTVSSSDVLAYLRSDIVKHEVIDRIYIVGEDELGPREDAEFVTRLVEVIDSRLFV